MKEQLIKAIQDGETNKAKEIINGISYKELNEINFPLNIDGSLCNNSLTPLYLAVKKNYVEICRLLVPKMSEQAINIEIWGIGLQHTALHLAVYNNYTEIVKAIIKYCPKAINAKDNCSLPIDCIVLDMNRTYINEKINEEDKKEMARLLIENGAIFKDSWRQYKDWFKIWAEAVTTIDQFFEKGEINTEVEIDNELNEMLVNRFRFKLIQKLEKEDAGQEFLEYKEFIQKQEKKLPKELYQKLVSTIDDSRVAGTVLTNLEVQLIKIIESTNEALLCLIPLQELNIFLTYSLVEPNFAKLVENTKKFYKDNPGAEKPGGYIKKLASMPEKELVIKLKGKIGAVTKVQEILSLLETALKPQTLAKLIAISLDKVKAVAQSEEFQEDVKKQINEISSSKIKLEDSTPEEELALALKSKLKAIAEVRTALSNLEKALIAQDLDNSISVFLNKVSLLNNELQEEAQVEMVEDHTPETNLEHLEESEESNIMDSNGSADEARDFIGALNWCEIL